MKKITIVALLFSALALALLAGQFQPEKAHAHAVEFSPAQPVEVTPAAPCPRTDPDWRLCQHRNTLNGVSNSPPPRVAPSTPRRRWLPRWGR